MAGTTISQERMEYLAAKSPDDLHVQILGLIGENIEVISTRDQLLITHGDIEQVLSAYRFHQKPNTPRKI